MGAVAAVFGCHHRGQGGGEQRLANAAVVSGDGGGKEGSIPCKAHAVVCAMLFAVGSCEIVLHGYVDKCGEMWG